MTDAKKKRSRNTGSLPARQRPDGRWETRLTLPDGRRRSFYGATWEEAEAKLTEARSDLAKGVLAEPGRSTFADLGEDYFRLNPDGARRTTLRVRRHHWDKWIKPAIGHVRLSRLAMPHLLQVAAAMREADLATATVNNVLTGLSNICAYGVSAKLLHTNPAAAIKRESPADPRELPITTPEQIAALLDAIQRSNHRIVLMLGIGLGLRSGEARGLRWRDIDFAGRMIRVRHAAAREAGGDVLAPLKTKASRRELPMPDFIFDELKRQRRWQAELRLKLGPDWTDLDLVATFSGSIISNTGLCDELVRMRAKTGIDGLVFHHLRHLCATMMMLNNVPPRIAQGVLGHATSATTMRIYQHVTSDALLEAAEAINQVFGQALRGAETS